jgi:hypothetical protein
MSLESELRKLANSVGARENAAMLFKPKLSPEDQEFSGAFFLQQLNFPEGTNDVRCEIASIPADAVTEWAVRCYSNTLEHLSENDDEVRAALIRYSSYLPHDEATRVMLAEKVYANFTFFLWLHLSPSHPLDANNCCILKFIVLEDVILLENVNAVRDGNAGGWGWIDKVLAGLRDVAKAFEIRKIKAVATNERIYQALLRRGFRDRPVVQGLQRHVVNYAKPVELVLS